MPKGIYAIECHSNAKVYYGRAVDIQLRWYRHRRRLRKGDHANRHLQAAWNKYGEAAFVLRVVEVVEDKADLMVREQFWIDSNPDGFNMASANGAVFNLEMRARMSAAHVGKPSSRKGTTLTPDQRAHLRAVNLGKKQSPETIAKRSQTLCARHAEKSWGFQPGHQLGVGVKRSPEARQRMREAALRRDPKTRVGIKQSPEARANMRLAALRRWQGGELSPETRAKLSKAALRRWRGASV